MRLAMAQAEASGQDAIGTEHLQLALIEHRDGIAAQVLAELGVADSVRERLVTILQSKEYLTPSNRRVTKSDEEEL